MTFKEFFNHGSRMIKFAIVSIALLRGCFRIY